jgi:hypothetical protein
MNKARAYPNYNSSFSLARLPLYAPGGWLWNNSIFWLASHNFALTRQLYERACLVSSRASLYGLFWIWNFDFAPTFLHSALKPRSTKISWLSFHAPGHVGSKFFLSLTLNFKLVYVPPSLADGAPRIAPRLRKDVFLCWNTRWGQLAGVHFIPSVTANDAKHFISNLNFLQTWPRFPSPSCFDILTSAGKARPME